MVKAQSPDAELAAVADYMLSDCPPSAAAVDVAHIALFDFLGCALAALDEADCRRIIRPLIPEAQACGGARVPGTTYEFDPATAAFAMGCMGRWLDFNDSWFGQGGGHPADMWGALLGTADWLSRRARRAGRAPLSMALVADCAVKAYEVLGLSLLDNDYGQFDYTAPLKAATAATVCRLLGGGRDAIIAALSQSWVDGQPLRVYRTPHTGPRKNWASPDAAARGVWHAFKAVAGEPGYPQALSTPDFGLYDVERGGQAFRRSRPYGSYVMENVLFKVYPAQFRAQTALEAAFRLHAVVVPRLDEVSRVVVHTHRRALQTVDKPGPLSFASERDHSLQYITAIGLLHGEISYRHYHDETAADPRVVGLMSKVVLAERPRYTAAYVDRSQGMDANAIEVQFEDGSTSGEVEILYPMGDPRRRAEALPVLAEKFHTNIEGRLAQSQVNRLVQLYEAPGAVAATPADEFMALTVANHAQSLTEAERD